MYVCVIYASFSTKNVYKNKHTLFWCILISAYDTRKLRRYTHEERFTCTHACIHIYACIHIHAACIDHGVCFALCSSCKCACTGASDSTVTCLSPDSAAVYNAIATCVNRLLIRAVVSIHVILIIACIWYAL